MVSDIRRHHYQLCCGLLRHLRAADRAEVNIFEQAKFHMFCTTLDSEMKHLSSTGQYIHKRQAEPISVEDESLLWELGLLGTTSPTVLLHSLVYMVGLYFVLRSGSEHRRLRYTPAQIQLREVSLSSIFDLSRRYFKNKSRRSP